MKRAPIKVSTGVIKLIVVLFLVSTLLLICFRPTKKAQFTTSTTSVVIGNEQETPAPAD